MSEQEFTDRLAIAVEMSGGVGNLARAAKISSRMLGKYLAGDSDPSRSRLISIATAAGVQLQWLATGEGPMRPSDDDQAVPADGRDLDEYALVPRYAVEVSAGHGAWPDQVDVVERLAFKRSWLVKLGLKEHNLVLVTARGDSMEPTFYDGDLLLVDVSQTGIVDGGVSVIRTDGLLLAKRLQAGFGDQVTVISDNPRYDRLTTTKDQLRIVGRVVWRGGKV